MVESRPDMDPLHEPEMVPTVVQLATRYVCLYHDIVLRNLLFGRASATDHVEGAESSMCSNSLLPVPAAPVGHPSLHADLLLERLGR